MRRDADYWIQKLQLTKHPEGGYFSEVYRSEIQLKKACLPSAFSGSRNVATAIYFLLKQEEFSAFHRIKGDEMWHFYYGDPLIIYELDTTGGLTHHHLANTAGEDSTFQCVIKAGHWFAAQPAPGSEYALVGCTVAPGFAFDDFELAEGEVLAKKHPEHAQLIRSLVIK